MNISESKYVDNFEEIRKLGMGCFGTVFKVKNKSNNVFYAIKKIELKDEFIEMDLRRIQIISALNSNFVVQYIDSWIEENVVFNQIRKSLFIQMELCSMNLRQFIQLNNELTDERFKTFDYFISCELFKELIESVNYLHQLNPPIIHRDLKPEHILITDKGNGRFLKLSGFGLATAHEVSVHTRMVGTMNYMAPEVRASVNYNTKSDIYSLAIIATEIFRFDDKRIIRRHTNLEEFNKYLFKYLNTNLEIKFKQFLETLSNCLLPEDYHSRPDCRQLLENINEFSVDRNIVLKDENISLFQSFLVNQNNILKQFFEFKIRE